ncbi:MAG: Uncharacterised protein [Hyphomonas sp. TMED17]|nr:MAG: Uncharacterised protein [Hyphomonas sp. TMED17]
MRLCPRIKVCGVALVMRMRILSVLARQRQALCLSQTHYCRYERLDDVIGIIIDGILPTLILNQVNYDECKANEDFGNPLFFYGACSVANRSWSVFETGKSEQV